MSRSQISAAGIRLAELVAAPYLRLTGLRVALVGGSVGRGCADQYSDLEMGFFWDEMPSDSVRRDVASELGAEILAFDRDGSAGREHLSIGAIEGAKGTDA